MCDPVRVSRRLAYVLRHHPDSIGITLDPAGWVEVEELLAALAEDGLALTPDELAEVVDHGCRRRYELADGRIRAAYGHSVEVELGLTAERPPDLLFHGTIARFLDAIEREGLRPRSRRQVHLSVDVATAEQVGGRRGRPVVLVVDAAAMHAAGHRFLPAGPAVWLTDHVPTRHLRRHERG